jgi:hypothetical protein
MSAHRSRSRGKADPQQAVANRKWAHLAVSIRRRTWSRGISRAERPPQCAQGSARGSSSLSRGHIGMCPTRSRPAAWRARWTQRGPKVAGSQNEFVSKIKSWTHRTHLASSLFVYNFPYNLVFRSTASTASTGADLLGFWLPRCVHSASGCVRGLGTRSSEEQCRPILPFPRELSIWSGCA